MLSERLPTARDLPVPPTDLDDVGLFLDFDGTLVELAPTPDAVVVDAALHARLDALADRLPGRVALISGRSIAQLDAMLGTHASAFAVAGSHGAEWRTAADGHARPAPPEALETASAEMAAFADLNGLVFESKTFGAALHYRLAPAFADAAIRFATDLAADHGLVLQRGKMMVELRAPGDKGAAVRRLIAGMPGVAPLAFGDDVTDEDAFVEAHALGGAGVLVGPMRETAALYRLDGVPALAAWIDAAVEKAA